MLFRSVSQSRYAVIVSIEEAESAVRNERRRRRRKEKLEEQEKPNEKEVYSRWIKKGTNTYIPTDNSAIVDKVKPGVYDIKFADGLGHYMVQRSLHLDDILIFPSSIHKTVLDGVQKFWQRREKFEEYGFAFKRGILLHGKPGCGKTCTINLVMKYVVEELGGVVLPLSNGGDLARYAHFIPEMFRVIQKNTPIVVIFEDIENMCRGDVETELLNVLDGLDQLDNVVYLATTNYIEHLKERIINRPSRFDRRIYVPMPVYEDRLFYFSKKLKEEDLKAYDLDRQNINQVL